MGLLFNRLGRQCDKDGNEVAGGEQLPLLPVDRSRDPRLPHPGNPKGEPNLAEREFETGTDEQAKQSAMNKLSEGVVSLARDNDWNAYAYERLRLEDVALSHSERRLEIAERQQALRESKNRELDQSTMRVNREFSTHMANLQMVELDPKEAKSVDQVLNGPTLEAIKTTMVEAMQLVVAQMASQK